MNKSFVLAAFFACSSFTSTIIESDNANYDGKAMYLKGSVMLKNEHGSISAENATIIKDDDKKDFALIQANDHVVFSPSFGGELTADTLEINSKEKTAILKTLKPSSWVTYHGEFSGHPLIFKSTGLRFNFSKENTQSEFKGINEILALGPIKTTYAKNFRLFSDKAVYKENNGFLTFYCDDAQDNCTLLFEDKSTIQAKQVILDSQKHLIRAIDPDGIFKAKPYEDVLFQAKELYFDENGNLLTLSKNVSVNSMGFCCFSDDTIQLIIDSQNEPPIKILKCTGKTILVDNKGTSLTCSGDLQVHRDTKKITLEGKEEPVLFEGTLGKIKAKKITIDFIMEQNKAMPSKIFFEGKVACFNDTSIIKDDTGNVRRFALADFVTYLPNKKELTLKSTKPSKVLFYDEIKKTKFSAEQIIIDLPDGEQKERIKTSGNVRMIFSEKEDAEFKKVFTFEE